MGVMDGIKILELARVPPAEMPAMMLADMGADVLKIESADPERPTGEEWVRRTIHAFTNRNKRSITLNMKAAEGQAIFRKLAATADVIVEGFRPGVMKRLGADYETMRALNPRIVYCSLSGFGQDGPYRDYPAHDMNYLSLAGVLNLIGGSYPYYAIYETRDGKLLTIGCTEPWLWANFCRAIGRPDFERFARQPDQLVRAANREEQAAREEIEKIIRTRDRDDWYERLVKADVCVGKVYDVEEMVRDPQINHRQMIVEAEHPTHGRVRQVGIAIKLSETPASVRSAAPLPGEHTDLVLKDLGLSAADIARLHEKKVVE